jgi:hypothetical protein
LETAPTPATQWASTARRGCTRKQIAAELSSFLNIQISAQRLCVKTRPRILCFNLSSRSLRSPWRDAARLTLFEAQKTQRDRLRRFKLHLCCAILENSSFLAKLYPVFVSFVSFCKNILVAAPGFPRLCISIQFSLCGLC